MPSGKKIPGICLRTTLIAGFPGETREDVEELKDFLQRMRFDRVGIFTHSHEEDTSAYALIDDVPAEEKRPGPRRSWNCSRKSVSKK